MVRLQRLLGYALLLATLILLLKAPFPLPVLLILWAGVALLWGVVMMRAGQASTPPPLPAATEAIQQQLRQLESQRQQAQAILDSMGEGVVALDREGQVLWLNGSAQRLLELTPDQAKGKRLTELLRHPELDDVVREALTQQRPASREIQTFGPREQAIRFQATPCEDQTAAAALVVVAQDVTEIRRLEGVRREFVANVSHELKTPLTSIKSLTETLLTGALEDAQNNRRFVTMIDQDATRLTRLIDDLLALSQIESKATPLNLQPVNLRVLIESLLPMFAQPMQERHITMEVLIPADAPQVQADSDRLRQVFVNLIDNAVKFNTPSGRVSIRAQISEEQIRILVEDTGAGIPEQDLPRIFERFYRVDKARSRELGGTGLGLAIVKHLVELHHGTVDVRSQPGQGSTFTVTLPLS
ncbi:MAG: phosphate regulon sensor histidine kinase PhoR [Candidatus Omnitrophica bacterium]|nr:phosphate regulon sensor histidine kinase PhoR [Candidatus Omnitrophota bacterium]